MEFQAACSAAGPKLGDYTQWVRWRAPIVNNKKKQSQKEESIPGRLLVTPDVPWCGSGWRRPRLAASPGRPEAPGSAGLCYLLAHTQRARRSSLRRLGWPSRRHRSPRAVAPKSPSQGGGMLARRLEGAASPWTRPQSAAPAGLPAVYLAHPQTAAEAAEAAVAA